MSKNRAQAEHGNLGVITRFLGTCDDVDWKQAPRPTLTQADWLQQRYSKLPDDEAHNFLKALAMAYARLTTDESEFTSTHNAKGSCVVHGA